MSRHFSGRAAARLAVPAVLSLLVLSACSGGSSSGSGPTGGPATGPLDAHCAAPDGGVAAQVTSPASCHPDGGMPAMDGGAAYGDTRFNAAGYDDDCKYHLSWTASPIRKDTDVTFTVSVTSAATGAAVTGADVGTEIYLSDFHPAPNAPTRTTEGQGGTYTIGPVRFDASGRWTVRFHLFEACSDFSSDSPHGHAAYFVDVP